jgi:hypothetical protein
MMTKTDGTRDVGAGPGSNQRIYRLMVEYQADLVDRLESLEG